MKKLALFLLLGAVQMFAFAQTKKTSSSSARPKAVRSSSATLKMILPGAYQTAEYFPKLKGKRVGVFANNTAMVGNTHLVDTLLKAGITVTKIFGPEHGFRGTADAGEKVSTYVDAQTGITVVSLYGAKHKPTKEDLADVDIMLFDIQDVGVRFYTYITSMQEYMEAALENDKPLIILDRPNPNGFYVDGPVLDTAFSSSIGKQPIPVVYGMTMGEYANFLIGEALLDKKVFSEWALKQADRILKTGASSESPIDITVIKCRNYTHHSKYILPIKPSPNLPDAGSVWWYPSTCFFEGTVFSEGRGTNEPFQIFGHPSLPSDMYAFTPVSKDGAKNPKLENKLCYGWNVSGTNQQVLAKINGRLQLQYLLKAYQLFPDKDNFFIKPKKENPKPGDFFFNKLAGNAELMQQIKDGKSEEEIRASWQPKLDEFKAKRRKYLMYEE